MGNEVLFLQCVMGDPDLPVVCHFNSSSHSDLLYCCHEAQPLSISPFWFGDFGSNHLECLWNKSLSISHLSQGCDVQTCMDGLVKVPKMSSNSSTNIIVCLDAPGLLTSLR